LQKKTKPKLTEDEAYNALMHELREHIDTKEEFLELANTILRTNFTKKDIDWENL
jgi:GH18 family chitinase